MASILGLTAFFAAIVVLARAYRNRSRDGNKELGATPRRPIAISSFRDIDDTLGNQSCACGGDFRLLGEGPSVDAPDVRFARLECSHCDRERIIYFEISATS